MHGRFYKISIFYLTSRQENPRLPLILPNGEYQVYPVNRPLSDVEERSVNSPFSLRFPRPEFSAILNWPLGLPVVCCT